MGKILAEKPVFFANNYLYLLLVASAILYYIEFLIIEYFGWSIHADCFITVIPLCTLIFIAIGQSIDVNCKYALWLRKSSIILYCTHFTIIKILRMIFLHIIHLSELVIYVITLIICLSIAFLII